MEGRRGRADPPQGAPVPGGRRRRGRAAVLQPRGVRALRGRAEDRMPARPGRPSRACSRSRATSRSAWAASAPRWSCGRSALEYHRQQEDLTRVADLHRKIGAGLWNQRRAQAGDRALPEGHQPAEGRPAVPRARAPVRGGGLALHARGRQHARDLRLREGAAAGGEAAGDARGEPRARHLRPRLRAHRRHREGAREPRALGRAGARLRRRRDDPRAADARAITSRSRRPTTTAPARPTARRSRSRSRSATCPRRWSCSPRSRRWPSYRAAWDEVEAAAEASADLAEREGLVGKLCYPCVLRGVLAWREGRWDDAEQWCRRAHELAEQVGWSEVSFAALYWLARALRDSGDYTAAITELDRALDVCERAGLIAQSIEAMSARAITLAIAGKEEQGRETAEEAGHLAERLHYPVGSAAALMARGTTAEDPEEATRMMREARELWEGIGRPLDAAIADLLLGHVLADAAPGRGARGARARGGGVRAARRRAPRRAGRSRARCLALCQTFRMPVAQPRRRRAPLGRARRGPARRDRESVLRAARRCSRG